MPVKRYRRYMVYTAVFAALLLSLYLLLVLSATIPNAAIRDNMRQSAVYHANANHYDITEDGIFQNITDNHADQMWLNIGWNMGYGNPFLSVLNTGYYDGMEHGPAVGLYLSVVLGREANTGYTRYWHGTAGLLRILHIFTNIHGVKTIGILCLIILIWKTLRVLAKHGYWDLGLCLLASLFWVQVWNLRLSAEYLPTFLICFGLCPAFLHLERRDDFYLNLLAIVSGTVTAFFDFLTTETVTILIPLILVIAIRSRERRLGSPKRVFRFLLRCGLCWILAYAGTFIVKWISVTLATGENHFLAALSSADQRIGGTVMVGQIAKKPGMVAAIAANLSVLFQGTSRTEYRQVIISLVIVAAVIILVYRLNQIRQKLHPGTMFLLMLGGIVLLRYCFLANHSYKHAFFTYRALASTILAVLAALVINLRPSKKGGDPAKWN
jgi:hypothetical protein